MLIRLAKQWPVKGRVKSPLPATRSLSIGVLFAIVLIRTTWFWLTTVRPNGLPT